MIIHEPNRSQRVEELNEMNERRTSGKNTPFVSIDNPGYVMRVRQFSKSSAQSTIKKHDSFQSSNDSNEDFEREYCEGGQAELIDN